MRVKTGTGKRRDAFNTQTIENYDSIVGGGALPQGTRLVSRSQPLCERIDYRVLACLLWLLLSLKATPDVLAYKSHSSSHAVPSQSINVDNQIRQLEPGKPIERALGGGE